MFPCAEVFFICLILDYLFTDCWTVWGLSQTHVFHQVKNWASLKPWSLLTCIWALVPIHLKNIENLMIGCTSKPVLLNRLQDYFCLFQQSYFLIDLVTKKLPNLHKQKLHFPSNTIISYISLILSKLWNFL